MTLSSIDAVPRPGRAAPGRLWTASLRILAGTAWISAAIFAVYILVYYLGAIPAGTPEDWNEALPRLYVRDSPAGNVGMGLHFALGALLLLAGPVQLVGAVRARWPRVHRRIGWVYAPAAFLTGLGGCLFIALRGTIGGPPMSMAFALYGALLMLSAAQTVRFAVRRDLARHRAWAIRLFALAIGSWLYRMDYGFWTALIGDLGRTRSFDGPFDRVMNVWFYVPNLLIAELAIRGVGTGGGHALRLASAAVFLGASLFILIGTVFFTWKGWGPVILWRLGLSA